MLSKRTLALVLAAALLVTGCAGSRKATEKPAVTPAPKSQGQQMGEAAAPRPPAQDAAKSSTQSGAPGSTSTASGSRQGEPKAMASAPAGVKAPPAWHELPPPTPPTDMYFQDYGENPLINTAKRPTSTFSVDVDTASFTLARNYLERGQLPPAEAIRAEEFINYFPQGYPRSHEAVAVYIEGAPSPFRPGMHLIEIGLQARQVKAYQRKHAVLTFVIDVSGSMNMENRLGLVKRSLHLLLDQLESDDQVGIVIYASQADALLEPTSDKEKIRRAIDRLQPGGSTYAEEGIRLGYEMAWRNFQKGAINRVLLLSDGVANVGRTGPEEILRQVEDYREKGIYLTTVGFGMGNYNDVLMEQLANKGDGQYAYVDDLDEARRVFVEQLTGTLQVVAKDTKVQVHFDPEQVAGYRLVGYENRVMANQDFRNDKADAGEMGSGQSVTALYEVQLTGKGSHLGSVSIRYKEPESGKVVEKAVDIRRSAVFSTPSAHLLWTASVAEFAAVLGRSPWAAETTIVDVWKAAQRATADLGHPENHQALLAMIDRARELGVGR
ncbi:MAG: YfbK domain-containing protein [Bacillota bacterium]